EAALKTSETALRLAPDMPMVWHVRGNAYAQLDRLDDARNAYGECLRISPSSTSCAQMLLELEANEGNCDAVESLSRRVVALAPDSPTGYEFLAGALFAKSHSLDAAREALNQRWARVAPDWLQRARDKDEFSLAILAGDFDGAERVLDRWE